MNEVKWFNGQLPLSVGSTIGKWSHFGSPFSKGPFSVEMQIVPSKRKQYNLGVKIDTALAMAVKSKLQMNAGILLEIVGNRL